MYLDYEKFTFLLLNSNEFSKNEEKRQIQMTENAFEKILSAESMRDLDKISDEEMDAAMQNIEKMCGDQGPIEKKKNDFLQTIKNAPCRITERIL